nr:ATP-binding protein [Pleurocapsa sp. MO_192.B19]
LSSKLNPRRSLKARLFWNTAVMILILSLFLSLLVGYVSGTRIESTRGQSLEQLAAQMANKLEEGLLERYKDIQVLSTLNSIRQPTDSLTVTRTLLEKLQKLYPKYSWIGLTDTQGNVLVSTGGLLEGKNASQRPWFQQAQTKPYIGDVHDALLLAKLLPNPGDEPLRFVDLAAPVTDSQDKFQGVLCAHLSWNWARDIERSLLKLTSPKNPVEIFITSRDGSVLLAPPRFPEEQLNLTTIKQASKDGSGYSIETWSNKRDYLTVFARSSENRDYLGLNWLVVVRQSKELAFAPVRSLQRQVLLTGLLISSLFAVFSWLNAQRISQPIVTLTNIADRLSQGEKQIEIPIFTGKDELAILSKSLTYMISTLNEREQALKTELQIRQQIQTKLKEQKELLQTSEARYRALSESLEIKVKERTQILRQKGIELEREISERKRAEEAAGAANRAKSEFLANMSHELRTPLNAILGFARLVSRDPSLERSHRENLKIISDSGEHLLELINDILDMSKIEAGKTTLQETDFSLTGLLDDLEVMFALQAKSKGLQLSFVAKDLPQYIKSDRQKLRQILINLLSNAIKFTDKGSVILSAIANTREDHSQLLFAVEDTGAGIAPEEIANVFQPFTQAQAGYKAQEGTGLGLAISYHFAHLMQGKLTVSSKLTRGSSFKLSLPLKIGETIEESAIAPTAKVIGLAPHQHEYRILVVEDKFNNGQLLVKLLKSVGFAVKEASNGQEAINLWETWSPHLIWMDMRMPVMNGDEATRNIKATSKGQATVIIALTASVFESQKGLVLSSGCDDFLGKPFKEEEIFNKMAQYLGVEYIYEELPSISNCSPHNAQSEIPIPEAIKQMPKEWIQKLHQAAIKLDSKEIEKLIEQIPANNRALAENLTDLIERVRFDILVEMTQRLADHA